MPPAGGLHDACSESVGETALQRRLEKSHEKNRRRAGWRLSDRREIGAVLLTLRTGVGIAAPARFCRGTPRHARPPIAARRSIGAKNSVVITAVMIVRQIGAREALRGCPAMSLQSAQHRLIDAGRSSPARSAGEATLTSACCRHRSGPRLVRLASSIVGASIAGNCA